MSWPMPSLSTEHATPRKSEPPQHEPLLGLGRTELASRLGTLGVPERQLRMRVSQLWSWLYVRGQTDPAAMTDIAKDLRAELGAAFAFARPKIVTEQVS